jgi:hypothetical protein
MQYRAKDIEYRAKRTELLITVAIAIVFVATFGTVAYFGLPLVLRSSVRCENAEGDSVPCAWLHVSECNEACQRKQCKQAGKRWKYADTASCKLKYFSSGGPDIAYSTDSCGNCIDK